jgi:hypothetical protein
MLPSPAAAAMLLMLVLAFVVAVPTSMDRSLLQQKQNLLPLTDLFRNRTVPPPLSMGAALSAAFHPQFLSVPSSKYPGSIAPNVSRHLDSLLADETLAAGRAHWHGSDSTWEAALQLIQSGRSVVPSSAAGKGKAANSWEWLMRKRPQEPAVLDAAAFEAWLAGAQAVVQSLPTTHSMPLLRRAIVALLLRAWASSAATWSSDTEVAAQLLVRQVRLAARAGAHALSSARAVL